MKLKSVSIKNFKRFSNFAVRNIPESARLIMLVGPNGCGKSSFFDALRFWHIMAAGSGDIGQHEYYDKSDTTPYNVPRDHIVMRWKELVHADFHGVSENTDLRKSLYLRSAYRNDPVLKVRKFEKLDNPLETFEVHRMIDNNASIARNYQRLVSQAVEDVFCNSDGSMSLNCFRDQFIGEVRIAFSKLFPSIELNNLGNPLEDGNFKFTKGTSKGFSLMNLSGGEKAAFDLILDLVIARRTYDDTVFCIDEPESHMSAKLQARLLSVLHELIPEKSQLMLATHSIGMMRAAQDIESNSPHSVVFLNFGDLDFDRSHVVEPTLPDRAFWNDVYKVALDDLAALVAPQRVVICEGEPPNKKEQIQNHSFDASCYNRIFEHEFPETRFVSMGNDQEIINDRRGLAEVLRLLIDGLIVVRLIDRDDRSSDEVADRLAEGIRVLSRRNLESYLFDDEILKALASSVEKKGYCREILNRKQKICSAKPNRPNDDLKPVSGQLYVECKKILGLTRCGNNARTFMRDTLSPLVTSETQVYKELRQDIFGDSV